MPKETPTDVLGAKVKSRRMQLGMSQNQLGEKLGVTFQQIQKYEKGTNRISIERITVLAKALNVDLGYFIEGFVNGRKAAMTAAEKVLTTKDGVVVAEAMVKMRPTVRRALAAFAYSIANE